MAVLLLAENWPPRQGGIENYLTNLAWHMPTKSVIVVAPKSGGSKDDEVGSGVKRVIRKRFFWPVLRPAWLPLFIYIYRLAQREKISVTLCGKALFEGLVGYYLKKYLNIPYVVFTYAAEIEAWAQKPRWRRRLVRVLKTADRVVYINDQTKQSLLKLGAREDQLVKIWPGVSERFFKPVADEERQAVLKKYKISRPFVLLVARLVQRKNLDSVIEAYNLLSGSTKQQLQLVLVGEGPERSSLEKLVAELNLKNQVILLGHVPDEDLPSLYAAAMSFVLTPGPKPADLEGFGIVYMEAAACGAPSIASQTEAVLHKKTGLIVQPQPRAVAEAIEFLYKNPSERERLGREAQKRALAQFQWNKRAMLVKGMLDAIMAEKYKKV